MAEDNGAGKEFSVDAGPVKINTKGYHLGNILQLLLCAAVVLGCFMIFEHRTETKDTFLLVSGAIKDLAKAQESHTLAQREMTCIISLPQAQREAEFTSPNGLCKRLSR